MQELAIAHKIVEIVSDEAQRRGGGRIEVVYLKVGTLAGVLKDALLFAWEVASNGSRAAGAQLTIEEVAESGEVEITALEIRGG